MTQPLTLVVLSTGLDNFKEIRTALSADSRVQLLAGGNDAEQLHEEIIRYVKEKYGEENVAQIGTFGTLAARA